MACPGRETSARGWLEACDGIAGRSVPERKKLRVGGRSAGRACGWKGWSRPGRLDRMTCLVYGSYGMMYTVYMCGLCWPNVRESKQRGDKDDEMCTARVRAVMASTQKHGIIPHMPQHTQGRVQLLHTAETQSHGTKCTCHGNLSMGTHARAFGVCGVEKRRCLCVGETTETERSQCN